MFPTTNRHLNHPRIFLPWTQPNNTKRKKVYRTPNNNDPNALSLNHTLVLTIISRKPAHLEPQKMRIWRWPSALELHFKNSYEGPLCGETWHSNTVQPRILMRFPVVKRKPHKNPHPLMMNEWQHECDGLLWGKLSENKWMAEWGHQRQKRSNLSKGRSYAIATVWIPRPRGLGRTLRKAASGQKWVIEFRPDLGPLRPWYQTLLILLKVVWGKTAADKAARTTTF